MNDSRSLGVSSVELHSASIPYEPDDTERPGSLAERRQSRRSPSVPGPPEPCHGKAAVTRWPFRTCPLIPWPNSGQNDPKTGHATMGPPTQRITGNPHRCLRSMPFVVERCQARIGFPS
jgi:hypothetical protein